MKPVRPLADVVFRPLDHLVWAGRAPISRGIALTTCKVSQLLRGQWLSHMSHCVAHENAVRNFESTALCSLPCLIQNKRVSGVQCHDPYKEIAAYDGCVWILRPRKVVTDLQSRQLTAFWLDAIGREYDAFQAGMSALPEVTPPFARSAALSCSQLRITSSAVAASTSPNTWGWRRMIFDVTDRCTSAMSKTPSSAAYYAWLLVNTYTLTPPELIWVPKD